jgi:hypothetical protein
MAYDGDDMTKLYLETLMKTKAQINLQLEQLRPFDTDFRECNKVVEALEEVLFHINWEITNSVRTRN